jgi:hypothetical protein
MNGTVTATATRKAATATNQGRELSDLTCGAMT